MVSESNTSLSTTSVDSTNSSDTTTSSQANTSSSSDSTSTTSSTSTSTSTALEPSSSSTMQSSSTSDTDVTITSQEQPSTESSSTLSGQPSLYRLYNPFLKVHLYTRDTTEYSILAGRGWNQEGVAWTTSLTDGDPVYRLYNPGLKVHLYTRDLNEYQVLASRGWKQEGIAYRSFGPIPIYRLYHSGIQRHLYTSDFNEYNVLGKSGWKKEGVAFYGLEKGQTIVAPTEQSPSAKLDVTVLNDTTFTANVTNVTQANTIKSIKLAVWSVANGQDDIVWYPVTQNSDGTYSLQISSSKHLDLGGQYQFHLYIENNAGQMFNVATQTATLPQAKAKANLNIVNVNTKQASFTVKISNLLTPGGMKELLIPVWSEHNGQDDIVWYTAQKQTDGTYRVDIRASNHKYTSGKYVIHAYYKNNAGDLQFLSSTSTTVTVPQVIGTVTLSSVNPTNWTFTTSISDAYASRGIAKVKVAVWSEQNGQDDLHWYDATSLGSGKHSALTRLSNHGFASGIYQVHTYYELKDGTLVGVDSRKITVQVASQRPGIQQQLQTILGHFNNLFGTVPGEHSFYVRSTSGTEFIQTNDRIQRSASTIKLFILAAAYNKAHRGELNLSAPYTIKASDIVTASQSLGNAAGQTFTIGQIARFMVETSDNTATNIIMRQIGGVDAVNAEIRKLGYTKTTMERYMHDPVAIAAGLDNYISAQEAADLMTNILNKTLISTGADGQMRNDLSNNYYAYWLTASIKQYAVVFDKPGNHSGYGVENDIAIITRNGQSVAVALLTQYTGSNSLTYTSRFDKLGLLIYNTIGQ
ncbi:GBS Bsp-like repeat-containing protein [Streptococcus suis]|nr:GBS Bsp-like repeat-containing protein [Streptococcus suis]